MRMPFFNFNRSCALRAWDARWAFSGFQGKRARVFRAMRAGAAHTRSTRSLLYCSWLCIRHRARELRATSRWSDSRAAPGTRVQYRDGHSTAQLSTDEPMYGVLTWVVQPPRCRQHVHEAAVSQWYNMPEASFFRMPEASFSPILFKMPARIALPA
jgi:hypothetical protein